MAKRYFAQKCEDCLKELIIGHGDLRARLKNAVGLHLTMVTGNDTEEAPSETLWHSLREIQEEFERIDNLTPDEVKSLAMDVMHLVLAYEAEYALNSSD
jgi:hypothetical protein